MIEKTPDAGDRQRFADQFLGKDFSPRRGSEAHVPGQSAFRFKIMFIRSENAGHYTQVTGMSVGDEPTKAIGDFITWLNQVFRARNPGSKFPMVVTDAEDPRLPMIDSELIKRADMIKEGNVLIKHGAIHFMDANPDLTPFLKFILIAKFDSSGKVVALSKTD